MDTRERNAKPQWLQYDTDGMVIVLDSYEDGRKYRIPAVFEVCQVCRGKGSHVNPSIDAQGISPEEFDNDPDFKENYFNGAYDQICNKCGGDRVVLAPRNPKSEGAQALFRAWELEATWTAEAEAERRMGA